MIAADYSLVVPTIGRSSLSTLLTSVAAGHGPLPREVVLVNDRPVQTLRAPNLPMLHDRLQVLPGAGRGPAAARNRGWRATTGEWVVFLDDDVEPEPGWRAALADDLAVDARVGAVAGRIHVPVPTGARPTDWQRQVMGLADATWITADIAYRRPALEAVGGFHEGFTAAFREDADLAARVRGYGFDLVRGRRLAAHPVGPASRWTSVTRQRGNADDVLLRRRYGRDWRRRTGVPRGRRTLHVLATAGALAAAAATATGRRRAALCTAALWLALTGEFATRRVLAGPVTRDEVATMALTSVLIPPVATFHWLRGLWRHRDAARVALPAPSQAGRATW
jgi:GT2 family glycosyltransferase